jgi:uncharacterized protein (UPF0333 family)
VEKLKFLAFGLLLLVAVMAFQLNSDFNSYYAERGNQEAVVEPEEAYIGYSCEKVLIKIGCFDGSSEAVILRIYNNINQTIHVRVELDNGPDGVAIKNGEFDIAPMSEKDVIAEISLPAGTYHASFVISATFENGGAEIFTICSSEIVVEKTTKPKISKVLVEGNKIVKTHTKESWTFVISVENPKENSTVRDTIPGEFNIVSYFATTGNVAIKTVGKAKQIFWTLSESGELRVMIETASNSAGKQEFTTPGWYKLNDGAELDGMKTAPIWVYAKCNIECD